VYAAVSHLLSRALMADIEKMDDQTTSAKAGLLLRLSSLGARESDIAIVREALFMNTELSRPKRSSNLEGSALKQEQKHRESIRLNGPTSPVGRSNSLANEELRQFFRREFSKQAVDAHSDEKQGVEEGSFQGEEERAFKSELPQQMVDKLDSWLEFDIFDFAAKADKEAGVLVRMGELLFDRHGFNGRFHVSPAVLRNFLSSLQASYNDLPYHNATHAADVAQSMSHFIVQCGLAHRGDDLMRYAAIVSACAHDVGHPGYTNRYLIETRSGLALTYNDKSPLENMHASKLFTTLWAHKDGRQDVTANFDNPRDVSRFRKLCIEMILATDNAHHEKTLSKLTYNPDDESIYKAAMHAADLGGGAKVSFARPEENIS
jgi:hypothetical protein